MAETAFLKAAQVMVIAIFIAIIMLMSSEVATAALHGAIKEVQLGRRILGAEYNTTGRGGYN